MFSWRLRMRNLISLVKIDFLNLFEFYKLKNTKDTSEKKKAYGKIALILFVVLYLGGFIYYYARLALKGLMVMNLQNLLLPVGFNLVSTYILIMTISTVNKTLFASKDYSILLSLPIKKSTIIASKIIALYLANTIYSFVLMIPIYLAYFKITNGFMFHFNFIISFFFIPLVPTVIGSLIGTILTALSSRFKYKNLINIIFNIAFVMGIMYVSYKSNSLTSEALANINKSLINFFNKIYPLSKLYLNLLDGNILSLLLFILISLALFEGFKYLTVLFFDQINSRLNGETINNKYNQKKNKVRSIRLSLLRKELKKYFSSTLYLLNTSIGMILLTFASIFLVIAGPKSLGNLLSIPNLSEMLSKSLPMILSLFCALSCTTYPTISLEGKSLWILKSSPIEIKDIFISKILLNLVITLPLLLINSIILAVYFHLSFLHFIILLVMPMVYIFFIADFGLLMNLLMPDFEWTNEIKVIKQSYAALITIFTGMILSIVPLSIDLKISSNLYSLFIILFMVLLNCLIYYLLFTKRRKIFQRY